MIPYSDPSEPDSRFPTVNIALILINFAVFFYELSLAVHGNGPLNQFITQYGAIPCEYTSQCSPGQFGTPQPFWQTLFTSMFMHAGWAHILGNMVFLWVFGDNIENSMGHFRYVAFYILCGLAATGLQIATSLGSQAPGLGASGAIAGVLGAYLLLYPSSRIGTLLPFSFFLVPVRLPAWVLIGFWFVLQLVSGLGALSLHAARAGGVAYFAHIGGFIAGVLLIFIFRRRDRVGRLRVYHGQYRSY